MKMKKKTDDLEKLDGVATPKWVKILVFILSFVVTCVVFYFIQVGLSNV